MDPVKIESERCKGCGLCIEFCPSHNLKLAEGLNSLGYHVAEMTHVETCTACALCAEMCPEAGIEVYRKVRPKKAAQTGKAAE